MSTLISIVSPVYKAELVLDELIHRLETALKEISYNFEIILVDDASPDNSWKKIKDIAKHNSNVKGIKLSRNFGQHYAITAGLDVAKGEWIVVMDCDLQDRPEEIPNLYQKAINGFDVVLASRANRQDNLAKIITSIIFYKILSYLTGTVHDPTVANFGIYNRKVIQQVCNMKESIRYFPTMVTWVGFKSTKLNVIHAERAEGKSNYNFSRLFNLGLDIVLAYSDKPIRLGIKFGVFIALISVILIVIMLYKYLNGQIEVLGYASLIISIWFLSGSLMILLGLIGLYVGKTFQGVKQRPNYVIDEQI